MKLFESLKKILYSPVDQEVVINKNSTEMQIEYLKQKGFLEENKKISLTFLLTGEKEQKSSILKDLQSNEGSISKVVCELKNSLIFVF